MLRLYTFGGLRIELDEKLLRLPTPKARDLLAYLILHHDRPLSRDLLAGAFWPDRPDPRARRALSQALWQVRSVLGPAADRLAAERDTVTLLLHPGDWLDVAVFEEASHATSISALRQAVTFYRADFLEGCYDDWALLERERLRELYLGTLERLIALHKQQGEYEEALTNAQRLAAADHLRESVHQELMRLYHLLGRDRAALEQYETLRQVLADEVGVEPMAETALLAQEIAAQFEEAELPYLPLEAMPAPLFDQPELVPLVGREQERAALLAQLEAAIGGRGGLVLVEGEAGVGKTRLLQEVGRGAEWRDVQVCRGRGRELAELPPYGLLREALQAALSPLRVNQLAELVEGTWLREVSRILPKLAECPSDSSPAVNLGPERQRARLLEALTQTVLALGQIAPYLLILDDLQWADETTLSALAYLTPRLAESRVLVIGAYRGAEAREQPAIWEALQSLDKAGGHHRLLLARLTAEQTGELVRRGLGLAAEALVFEERSSRFASLCRGLYQETEGNPLFVLETLRALRDEMLLYRDEDGVWSTPWDQTIADGSAELTAGYAELPLPAGVFQVIARRLKRLNITERKTLNVAAVLGDDFDFALLTQAGELEREDTLAAVGELLQRRFLVEGATAYGFSHDKVRQVAYESIQERGRQRLHRRAGRALENLHPEQVEQLAHHFDLGQVWDKAVEYNHRAGERAKAVYAGAEAIGYYDRALEAWRRLGPPDEELGLDLYQERGGIYQDTGRFDQAEADFRAAHDLAERAGDRMGQAHVLNHLSYLQFQRGDFDKAAAIAHQVLHLSAAAGLQSETATGLFNRANAIRNLGRYQQAIALYEQAAAIYETSGEQARLADSLNRMGAALYHTGDYARGQRAMERSLSIRRRLDDKVGISYSLVNLSSLYYHQGQFGSARKAAQEASEIASSIGDPYGEDAALNNLGMTIREQGDPAQAVLLLRRALEIGREIGDQALEPDALSELGKAYHVLGDLEQAQKMLEKALEMASISVARFQLPLIHVRLAQLFLARGQDGEALTQAHAGLQEAEGVGDPWQKGVAHRMMAQVAAQIGSKEAETEPATHFEESVHILREIGAEAELARSLAAYSLYLRRLGDADRARRGATMMEEARALFQRLGMARDLRLLDEEAAACPPPGRIRVRLPAASAPTGRPLRDGEYATVAWTVAVPEDEVIPGKVTRRRHRILRLLREAAEQSAAPTAPDLAKALGVGARTIERDLAALRDAGHDARTRGSRSP